MTVVQESPQDIGPDSASNGIETGLFLHSQYNLETAPDLQFFFGPTVFAPPGYAHLDTGFTGAVCLTRLQNVGTVRLRSRSVGSTQSLNPEDPPIIQMNYLQHQTDVHKVVEGVKIVRQLMQSSGFEEFGGKEIAPGEQVQSDEEIEHYIRDTCTTAWHPVGTCKMGVDSMAVVDPELRVDGIQGLRVVDASIMPTIITGNTNAPTMMIGEKAADLIKAAR